jgi:hypothetical protein
MINLVAHNTISQLEEVKEQLSEGLMSLTNRHLRRDRIGACKLGAQLKG